MLKIAFEKYEKVEVSDYEINKQGKSFTYLTVEHFKNICDGQLYFIVGGDMLVDFKTWRYPERILAAANLAVFGRDDFFTDYAFEEKYFKNTFNKGFKRLSYQGESASSTKIRIYSAFGLPLDGLTDPKVSEYITEKKLYASVPYADFIKKTLPEKRLKHTANVVIAALSKAKALGLDEQKVLIACTLHDCAKYIDKDKVGGFVIDDDVPAPVVHAFLGAYLAEKVLNVGDQEIVDAIRYHTSGKPNMSTLAKLVFVADMVEEDRIYQGVKELRAAFEKDDFEECFKECLKEEVQHLLNKKQYIYKATLDAYEYYLKEGRK
jgi:nicotinate-nucleotide adenylyltransferase